MKRFILTFFAAFSLLSLDAQTSADYMEGYVSYISSQNVYVKFQSTEGIKTGDTLFIISGHTKTPALLVNNLSSISCLCTPVSALKINVSDKLFARPVKKASVNKNTTVLPAVTSEKAISDSIALSTEPQKNEESLISRKQNISGRVSIASYSNLTNTPSGNSQRMRYTVNLNAKNIADSKLSAESYISFVHRNDQWDEIKSNIYNGLKIYNLSLNYTFGEHVKVILGRKINPRISNMGAVDGLQVEVKSGSFVTGILAGSRPDYTDYSFNSGLAQYGGFISHEHVMKRGSVQSTLAFVEQKNGGVTDRRFAYIQHSNSLVKNLSFFGSAEFDLYKKVDEVQDNSPSLSNLYLSFRYRLMQQLSFSLSYSSRQNIIYYETYKTFIEQLLESETQQGYLFQVNARPMKKMSAGVTAGYRFRKGDPHPSNNLYAYLTYSQLPYINVSATLSATLINTSYLSGGIYSLSFNKDIINGKLSGGIGYRFIDYNYINTETGQLQHIGEINLNWRINRKLSFSMNYEGTYDSRYFYNRIYGQLTRRF